MAGAIRHGALVRLVPPRSVAPGDVVMAALPDDRLVLHRIERIDDGTVHLRGDSCWRRDPPIAQDALIASVDPTPRPTLRALAYHLVPL